MVNGRNDFEKEASVKQDLVIDLCPTEHINSLSPGKLFMLFSCPLIFSKINFFEKFFHEYHLSVKQIGPNLGPNCLQRLSADDT